MIHKIKIAVLLSIFLIALSCGFKPIYQTDNNNLNAKNFTINFLTNPSYEIKSTIDGMFSSSLQSVPYLIDLNIIETQTPLIINTDGTVSKYRIEILFHFIVHEVESNKNIYEDIVRGFAEYIVQTSEYETEEKKRQMLKSAAQEAIRLMLTKIQGNIARD